MLEPFTKMDFKLLCGITGLLLACYQSVQARPSHVITKRKVTNCDSCLCQMCDPGFICVDGNGFPAGTNCIPHSVYLKRLQELKNGGKQTSPTGSAPTGTGAQTAAINTGQANTKPATGTGAQTAATTSNTGQANVNPATGTSGAQTAATNSNTGQANANPASGTGATNNNQALSTNVGTNNGQNNPASNTATNTGTNVGGTNGGNQQNTAANTQNTLGIQHPGSSNTNPSVSSGGGTGISTGITNPKPGPASVTFPPTHCSTCLCMEKTNACPKGYSCRDLEHGVSVGPKCVIDKTTNTQPGVSSVASSSGVVANSGIGGTQQNTGNQQGVPISQVVAGGPVAASTSLGCPIHACTNEKKAVCATNGITYPNMCHMIAAFCNDNSIKFLYHGQCHVSAMVLNSRCGACTCPDHVGGCEEGFKCMTSQEGFPTNGGAVCLHESLLLNQNAGVNVGSFAVPAESVQRSVSGPVSGFKCSKTSTCFNKGYCENSGTCRCTPKFSGQRCETEVAHPKLPCEINPCPAPKKCINQNIGRICA